MIRVGLLSDTHLYEDNDLFHEQITQAFDECSVIIHAGDLCDISILKALSNSGTREVHAVHGNMCTYECQQALPTSKLITLADKTIGLCHGANGPRHNIEERVWDLFPQADCIVYGHSHQAVCHFCAGVLFINPGSFLSTGPHGAPGSYAILTIDHQGMRGSLHQLPYRS
ncbi:MAG: YfcE family phosphodiesterase [Desulfobulbaceae bacterium]|uniref:Phosphoesterase n=1 Tax=Candidatus Desulfatifera sulfidica TaxID=2841691 RepID=A0A8J6N888_9BACT|nr:YfcE family phosphodiesterase [Candidatus Desulfatifera sulfidica]